MSLPFVLPRIRDIATPLRFGSQAHGKEEDEMASPQKIPPSFSLCCSTGWRGHTPWSVVYEASPLPALSDVALSQKFSAESHPALPRAAATDFLPGRG